MKPLLAVPSLACALALLLSAMPTARAAPAPDSGPTAGGTTVVVAADAVTFTEVDAGGHHSLALGTDGHAYAWGVGTVGQLGVIGSSSVPVAVRVPDGVTFTGLSAGGNHSLALGSDGHAYAWGVNSDGQLGTGTSGNSSVPVRVQAPDGVTFTRVAAGSSHSVATGSDGHTYAWGSNRSGMLGDGGSADSRVPVRVQVPDGVTFTDLSVTLNHSVALGSDGRAYAWGSNNYGMLGTGDGAANSPVPVPVQLPDGVTFTAVDTGNLHAIALGSDGRAYTWGQSNAGQLGLGAASSSTVPMAVHSGAVPDGVTFTGVAAGGFRSLALGSDGLAYAWGSQLGDGTTELSRVPRQVQLPDGVSFVGLSGGGDHSLARGSDGATYAWGSNATGRLGNGTTDDSSVPVPVVPGVPVVTSVSFGGVPGTDLVRDGDRWSVRTPAQCGVVDVAVTSTVYGASRTQTTVDGFTFGTVPLVTEQPEPATLPLGERAVTLTAAATGDDLPTVQWQRAVDGDWVDLPGATAPTLTTEVDDTTDFRAVFGNCVGQVATRTVTVTTTAPVAPTVTGTPPAGVVGQAYSHTFAVSGDPAPAVTLAGDLPAGLSFDADTATIAGTPSVPGTFPVTVSAANGTAPDAELRADLTVAAVLGARVAHDPIPAGARQSVTGTGFAPGERVEIVLSPGRTARTALGVVEADATGAVRLGFAVPADTAAGAYSVTLAGSASGSTSARFAVTVPAATPSPVATPSPAGPAADGDPLRTGPGTPGADGGWLAVTGPAGWAGIGALAVALIAAGAFARRRVHQRSAL